MQQCAQRKQFLIEKTMDLILISTFLDCSTQEDLEDYEECNV